MRVSKVCAGLFLAGSVIVTGCKSADNKPAETPAPSMGGTNGTITTMPTTSPTTTAATLPTTVEVTPPNAITPVVVTPATAPTSAPAAPAVTATHVITKAQPYFTEVPTSPTTASAGMFPSGTKVLVFSFSGAYAKVTAEDGTTGYTATEGLDPISKK
jgi:hypothetical protein